MDKSQLIAIGILGLAVMALLLYAVTVYNSLVAVRREMDRAWANIDVLLQQRFDELPKLVEVCKAYMRHEQGTLDRVLAARGAFAGASGTDARVAATVRSVLPLQQLFAMAEAYPDLKANGQFAHLRKRISEIESGIADRRESYNDVVNAHNVRIEQFPDRLLAALLGYRERRLFEFEPVARTDPAANDLLTRVTGG